MLLDSVPLLVLLLAAFVCLWLAMEGGYRLGQWRRAQTTEEKDQVVGAIVAAILGLLALVLGFTFSLAASRFDARRQVVLNEANAIGTAYLRTDFLPEPQRAEIARLLREYVDVRIRGVASGDPTAAIARSEQIHNEMWRHAAAAGQQQPQSITIGLCIQSLNEVIDLHSVRIQAGMRSRIPLVIWGALFGLALLGMASVGYYDGLSGTIRSPAMLGLVLAFTCVLYLIADLDRGHEGLLQIGQQALVDVQRSMQPLP
jgi:hypothetical protein